MKLRNMSAHVTEERCITIELASGEILNLEDALVLTSYASRVAVIEPRADVLVVTFDDGEEVGIPYL